ISGVTWASCAIRVPAMRNAGNNMRRRLVITVPPLYLRRLQSRLPGLLYRPLKPVVETHPAQLRVIVGKQCPLAHSDPVVARLRVRDYLSRVLARGQVPPGGFIQTKLLRSPDLNSAVHR